VKATDRRILIGVATAALVIAFLLLVLMPKRHQAGDLAAKVSSETTKVEQTEQNAAFAAAARKSFPSNYRRLVVLGKAVPVDDDTSSLLVEVGAIADRSNVDFRSIELDPGAAGSAPAAPATTSTTDKGSSEKGKAAQAEPAAQPVAATEESAANLPIGATVGSAGLPVMPYKVTFRGSFFDVAGFLAGIDRLVSPKGGHVTVRGRLMTIDGFALSEDPKEGFPKLKASFAITTYLTPAAQGLTAGATPSGPAVTSKPESTPVTNTGATP
jgi:hypothetical protein